LKIHRHTPRKKIHQKIPQKIIQKIKRKNNYCWYFNDSLNFAYCYILLRLLQFFFDKLIWWFLMGNCEDHYHIFWGDCGRLYLIIGKGILGTWIPSIIEFYDSNFKVKSPINHTIPPRKSQTKTK
jgi:hypothetical protein